MKKSLRLIVSVVLSAVLVLSLAACSTNNNPAVSSVSSATESSEGSETVSNNSESQPIGIITAMSNELKMLLDKAEISETKTIGGVDYNIGKLEGQDVVLVQGGIGKAMAAAGTTVLINEFNVKSIIFTGIAGGVGDEVKVLDEVIATDLVFHDYGNQTNDGFVWNAEGGVNEDGSIPVDKELSQKAYDAAISVLGEEHVFQGRIATGDQFVASSEYVTYLQDEFDAIACEMEGAAVARIAAQYEVPCCVIRAMSDKADGAAHDTYENFGDTAADNSAKIVLTMLQNM
jgi:adenosylhomocysteine nucleosidase